MILILDNYDSFTYNLVQQVEGFGYETKVRLNDACTLEELIALKPEKLIISPGPKTPADAGICIEAFRHFESRIPVLGVCLGHQVIAASHGVGLQKASEPFHGSIEPIATQQSVLYAGLSERIEVARYHSLVIKSVPETYKQTGTDILGEIMSIEHETLPVFGVQYHPESFMTKVGDRIVRNFLELPSTEQYLVEHA